MDIRMDVLSSERRWPRRHYVLDLKNPADYAVAEMLKMCLAPELAADDQWWSHGTGGPVVSVANYGISTAKEMIGVTMMWLCLCASGGVKLEVD